MRRVLVTNPRSGTHYLKTLVATILGSPPVEQIFTDAGELRATICSTPADRMIYGHFHYTSFGAVLDPQRLQDLRLVVLTRHPLDRLISQLALERASGGCLPRRTSMPQRLARELMLGRWDGQAWDDGCMVADYAAVHNHYLRELISNWLEFRPCHLVRFEQLIANPVEVLAECLDHLQVTASMHEIRRTTELVNFRTMSNGRMPGQVDVLSHYRCGLPGEWRSVFSLADIETMRPKFAEAFASAGYVL